MDNLKIIIGLVFVLIGFFLAAGAGFGLIRQSFTYEASESFNLVSITPPLNETAKFQDLLMDEGDSVTVEVIDARTLDWQIVEGIELTVYVMDSLNTTIGTQEFVSRYGPVWDPACRWYPQLDSPDSSIDFTSSGEEYSIYVEVYVPTRARRGWALRVDIHTTIIKAPPYVLVVIIGTVFLAIGGVLFLPLLDGWKGFAQKIFNLFETPESMQKCRSFRDGLNNCARACYVLNP